MIRNVYSLPSSIFPLPVPQPPTCLSLSLPLPLFLPLPTPPSFHSPRNSPRYIWRACMQWDTNATSVGGTRAHTDREDELWALEETQREPTPLLSSFREPFQSSPSTRPFRIAARKGSGGYSQPVKVSALFCQPSIFFSRSPVVDGYPLLDIRWTWNWTGWVGIIGVDCSWFFFLSILFPCTGSKGDESHG